MNRTVERTFSILDLVASTEGGITLQEIADHLGLAKSSAFVIVHSLLELGYIKSADHNEKKYCLGIEAFKLGSKYLSDVGLVKQCARYLPPLADRHKKTSFLAVLNGCDVVYLYKYAAPGAQLATCAIGSTKPAHATALGKTLLAFLPDGKLRAVMDQIDFTPYTPNTITTKEALWAELQAVRQRGFATERGEQSDLTFCYGAPIFDYTGSIIASISLADIANEHEDEAKISADLMAVAREISQSLGFIRD